MGKANNGFDNMFEKEIKKSKKLTEVPAENDTQEQAKQSRTALGRPKTKTEPEKVINIAVPLSVYKKMNLAKLHYNNNLTLYINSLIERDLAENLENYKSELLDI